jgi:type IV pilus assembly protein PilB
LKPRAHPADITYVSEAIVSPGPVRAGLEAPGPGGDPHRRIGDVIVELGFADRATVENALVGSQNGRSTGQVLVESEVVDSSQLARALAARNGFAFVDLSLFEVDKGAAALLNGDEARRYGVVPIAFLEDGALLTATADPANLLGLDNVAVGTGYEVRPAICSPEDLEGLLRQLSRLSDAVAIDALEEDEESAPAIELHRSAEEAPVVALVHSVIADAVAHGASDIHCDPRRGDMRIRLRIDGVTIDSTTVPSKLVPGLVSRIKIMAELDIAEHRVPQDGRIGLTVDGRRIDLRVATLPVMRGESVVMRILDKERVVTQLDELGMGADNRELVRGAAEQIHGAVLATGPTGSGKTTTLYALLNEVNTPDRTVITIEDPVEYELDGVKQVQVNNRAGLSFAAGLRSMVRSDPDVLMVGEIRDSETAQIAVESALTGHLVLSTLHTNDAPMAAARLIDMGIEPFLIASGIECIIAQRLARRLCEGCKRSRSVSAAELERSGFEIEANGSFDAYEPNGCVRCGGTGYRGRIGLFEVMVLSDRIRSLILRKASAQEIGDAARADGMCPLREDGLAKVRDGITSIPEVLRVLGT